MARLRDQQVTKERYAKLLSVTDRFMDANAIIDLLICTDVTARKYMKILIEKQLVELKYERSPANGCKQRFIKPNQMEITAELLDDLQQYQANKFTAPKDVEDEVPASYVFGENGVYRMNSKPSADILKKMRDTVSYDMQMRKKANKARIYPSGSSLNSVMMTANY